MSQPKILVTGKLGQVGFELQRSLAVLGEVIAVDRDECDLADPAQIRALVQTVRPDVIVNPAAHTAVDKAETDIELATAINATAPGIFAEEAAKLGALLVHYSTDYVFDGRKDGWYTEEDVPNPQSVYGQSKWAGEQAIARAHDAHIILRTSWVLGAHGGNFLKTMLRLMNERDTLSVIDDQYGAPTTASLLADVTAHIVRSVWCAKQNPQSQAPVSALYGTYHLVAAGETSWCGYAKEINQYQCKLGYTLKTTLDQIKAIPTSAYPLPAPRPANSRLATDKLRQRFGLTLPAWQQGVHQVLTYLAG